MVQLWGSSPTSFQVLVEGEKARCLNNVIFPLQHWQYQDHTPCQASQTHCPSQHFTRHNYQPPSLCQQQFLSILGPHFPTTQRNCHGGSLLTISFQHLHVRVFTKLSSDHLIKTLGRWCSSDHCRIFYVKISGNNIRIPDMISKRQAT